MKQNILILIILSAALLACEPQTGSEEFQAPKIESAEVVVDGLKASFSCTVSDERAESFGFAYGIRGEEKTTVMCELNDGVFETMTGWLVPGETYEWYAFVRAGDSESPKQFNSEVDRNYTLTKSVDKVEYRIVCQSLMIADGTKVVTYIGESSANKDENSIVRICGEDSSGGGSTPVTHHTWIAIVK